MKHLSSPEGRVALRNLALARTLFAFDFDGTLAPIVPRPHAARAAFGVQRRLAQLARSALVAVISGRGLADLRERIPAEVRHCIGNHGSEMRQISGAWVSQLRGYLADPESNAGIIIEDKGLTLSVHYRMAADRALAAQRLNALVARLVPEPRVIGGKLVLNLLPPNARTKYEALVDLAQREGVERVLFIGDDETDELVFAQAPAHWTTVRVEPDGTSRARFYIDRQSDVSILLDQLLKLLRRQSSGTGI
jgi:trehalose 6-phosphate phosphatase